MGWGIAFLLIGAADLITVAFSNASMLSLATLWEFMTNPCSIIGVITLAAGLRGITMARRHGGDLRWVLTDEGIYSIRDGGSAGGRVPWSKVRKVYVPYVFGLLPRRWRLITIRRRWGSPPDLLRRRTPALWIKGKTRREMISMAVAINLRFLEGDRSRSLEDRSLEDQSDEEASA